MPQPEHELVPGQRLDIERLRATAAASTTMVDFLTSLHLDTDVRTRKNMQARLSRARISTAHWRRPQQLTYSRSALAEAVRQSVSVAEVLRRLKIRQAGGSHAHLTRRIRREGLSTEHFLGQAHGRAGAARAHRPEDVLVVLNHGSRRRDTKHLRKALLELGRAHLCAVCGLGPMWLDKPLTLIIDHVDGNWLDNRPANVRFLCPNCHAQTASWCRRKVLGP
ncbi:MAG: hypothetical protein NVS3B26_30420 [Mycobacteriales bacterium]